MLKYLAVFAVFLAVAQTPVPTAGKTPDARAHEQQYPNESRGDANSHRPPAQPFRGKEIPSQNKENAPNSGSSSGNQTFIIVTNAAPRSVPWSIPKWIDSVANILLVAAGFLGVGAAIWAGIAAHKTLKTTLRPKLLVRRIRLVQGASKQNAINPWIIEMTIANIGGSCATITRSNLTIGHDRSGILGYAPDFDKETNSLGKFVLDSGKSETVPFTLSHDMVGWQRITQAIADQGRGQNGWIYCLGFIEYRDSLDVIRNTGFFRKYVVETRRFVKIEDPDYEYAD